MRSCYCYSLKCTVAIYIQESPALHLRVKVNSLEVGWFSSLGSCIWSQLENK